MPRKICHAQQRLFLQVDEIPVLRHGTKPRYLEVF
jgi:hypothetical protein